MTNLKNVSFSILFVLISLLSVESHAEPTNFSYTTLGVGIGKETLNTSLCLAGECYKEFGTGSINGSIQFADDLLILSFASSSASNSGPSTKWTSSVGSISLRLVKNIGSQLDIHLGVGSLSGRSDFCQGSTCTRYEDNGIAYGAGANIWIDSNKKFAGKFVVISSKYSKSTKSSTSTAVGLSYYLTQNHEIGLALSNNEDSSSRSIDYNYHF